MRTLVSGSPLGYSPLRRMRRYSSDRGYYPQCYLIDYYVRNSKNDNNFFGVVPDIHFASPLLAYKLSISEKSTAIKSIECDGNTNELAKTLTE
jgi:hypothetical protein